MSPRSHAPSLSGLCKQLSESTLVSNKFSSFMAKVIFSAKWFVFRPESCWHDAICSSSETKIQG